MSASEKHFDGEKAANKKGEGKPDYSEVELSASGFAGMLSQRRKKEPDPLGAPPPAVPRGATRLPTPKPVANPQAAAKVEMPKAKKSVPAQGGWPTLVPELYLLGWLLLVLGAWGVLLLMNRKILPGLDLSDARAGRVALAMMAGIPLGVLVMLGTRVLQLKGRKAEGEKQKSE